MQINELRWSSRDHRLELTTVVVTRVTAVIDDSLAEAIRAARAVSPPVELDADALAELEARDRAEWARMSDELRRLAPQPVEPRTPPLAIMRHLVAWASQGDGAGWRDGLARYAIGRAKDDAAQAGADMLAQALRDALEGLSVALEGVGDDVSGADAVLIGALAKTGEAGAKTSAGYQAKLQAARAVGAVEGWNRWLQEPEQDKPHDGYRAPWAEALARCLWADSVRARWERAAHNPPGLTVGALRATQRVTSPATARYFERKNDQIVVSDDQGVIARTEELALSRLDTLQKALERGADALRSTTGMRAIIGLVIEADRRVHEDQVTGYSPILSYDGLEDMARKLGLPTNKRALGDLSAALEAGAALRLEWPGGELRGLWLLDYRHEGGSGQGRVGRVEIVLAPALLPRYALRLPAHDGGRLIAPMTPLGALGNPKVQRVEASLHLRLAGLFTDRSIQIPQEGGVRIGEADIRRLANELDTSTRVIEAALERWCSDGDEAPAVLERIGDRYTYAANDVYGAARLWLAEQGRRRISESKRGQASRVKRAKAIKSKRKQ